MSDGNERKTWACPKERSRFYSKQYQDRMRAEGGEKHAAYLAGRRASDAKRREARRAARGPSDAERIRKMAEDVRKARVASQRAEFRAKVNAQIQQAGNAEDRRAKAKAAKAQKADALAGAPARHDDFPDTEAFIASNPDKLIRLPPGVWSAPLRFTY